MHTSIDQWIGEERGEKREERKVKREERREKRGERREERGERREERGERREESGERRAESGERRAESGERRAESGEWRAESGERREEREGLLCHPCVTTTKTSYRNWAIILLVWVGMGWRCQLIPALSRIQEQRRRAVVLVGAHEIRCDSVILSI